MNQTTSGRPGPLAVTAQPQARQHDPRLGRRYLVRITAAGRYRFKPSMKRNQATEAGRNQGLPE